MVMLDLQFECDFIDYRNVELHNFFLFRLLKWMFLQIRYGINSNFFKFLVIAYDNRINIFNNRKISKRI